MNRREILRYTAWITGAAVSAPLAGAILSGCSEAPGNPQSSTESSAQMPVLHYFSPDKFLLLTLIADTILPRTDSPSASDVQVPATVDSMLGQVFEEDYQAVFKLNWLQLENYLRAGNFATLDSAAQVDLLRELELGQSEELISARSCFTDLKQQVIAYYLTKEEIGEKYLNYVPIPGKYEPCISLEEANNRAWAI